MVLVRFVICAIRRALLCLFFSFLPFSSQKNVRSKHTVKGSSNTLHSNRITFGRERERIAYQFVRISGRVFLLVSKSFTRKRKKKKRRRRRRITHANIRQKVKVLSKRRLSTWRSLNASAPLEKKLEQIRRTMIPIMLEIIELAAFFFPFFLST